MFAFWGFDLSWDDSQRELGGTKCFASSVWRASCSLCRKKLSPNLNDSLFRDLFIPFFRPGLWCCCFFSYPMITFISYTRNSEFREYFGGWVIKVFFLLLLHHPVKFFFIEKSLENILETLVLLILLVVVVVVVRMLMQKYWIIHIFYTVDVGIDWILSILVFI